MTKIIDLYVPKRGCGSTTFLLAKILECMNIHDIHVICANPNLINDMLMRLCEEKFQISRSDTKRVLNFVDVCGYDKVESLQGKRTENTVAFLIDYKSSDSNHFKMLTFLEYSRYNKIIVEHVPKWENYSTMVVDSKYFMVKNNAEIYRHLPNGVNIDIGS